MKQEMKVVGALARFEGPGELLSAARKVREGGYQDFDCHSPFPIHGMNEAMGEKRSLVGWIAGLAALAGGSGALALQGWSSTFAYPLVISGKPFFSYQAYFPITFALAVLSGAFGALLGFMGLMKLRFHHPVFNSERFARFSDDGFFVSVEATDAKFETVKTGEFLRSIGGVEVELLTETTDE